MEIEKFLKIDWNYSYSRSFGYQKVRLFNYGYWKGFLENFNYNQKGFILSRIINGNTFEYFSVEEVTRLKAFFLDKFTDKNFIIKRTRNLPERINKYCKNYVEFAKLLPKDCSKLSNGKIVKILEKYYREDNKISIWFWFLFGDIEDTLNAAVEKMLERNGFSEAEINDLLSRLSEPVKMVTPDLERISILKIALLGDSSRKSAIRKHAEKFACLSIYEIDSEPRNYKYFEDEIIGIKDKFSKTEIAQEIDQILEKYKKRKITNNKILGRFKNKKELYYLLKLYLDYGYLKDLKPYTRDFGSCAVRPLFLEIAKRLGISLHQAIFLDEKEIPKLLKNNKLVSKNDLDERSDNSAYVSEGKNIFLVTDKKQLDLLDKVLADKKDDLSELKGLGVSKGVAKGKAFIVLSNKDFGKISDGDILVASATRPEYIPVMKKSGAIVTDEGGFLSHAAIVSRELGKPCIVGTKKATRAIKDGDLVEVDANSGIIRIIKN